VLFQAATASFSSAMISSVSFFSERILPRRGALPVSRYSCREAPAATMSPTATLLKKSLCRAQSSATCVSIRFGA
jgi:hypothetical protein